MLLLRVLAAVSSFSFVLPTAKASGAEALPADKSCQSGLATVIQGTVRDSTQALVPGAHVSADGGRPVVSGADGHFRLRCLAPGQHTLGVQAEGFAPVSLKVRAPQAGELNLILQPDTVRIGVEVDADVQSVPSAQGTGESQTISGKQLQSLADDPDDLLNELQQLGASVGGNPANTTLSINGFQDSGKLPPKSSIAYIRINPDQFSAEYREPPFDGGRVEIYTKPGQKTFHGALFATNGSPWMNASDPFATSRAPLGKQRYGFELSGPLRRQGADFVMDLEHRSIDNFAVVNAVGLDSSFNQVSILANVPTPQRRWIGEGRVDWQLGAKNTFIGTYSTDVDSTQNNTVGGTNLAESGYSDGNIDESLRLTNVTTISPHLMQEAKFALRWIHDTDVPNSTAPQLQVAGAFTGGGAQLGPSSLRELRTEIDDDAILTAGKHSVKFGVQLMSATVTDFVYNNFNGTYNFGGGVAPALDGNDQPIAGQTQTISGIEQYRRALKGLPGGTPTVFSNTEGDPLLKFTQLRDWFFVQDEWNVEHGVTISGGVRYAFQTRPTLRDGATPRFGILWSPTKKGTWTLHAHAGMFTDMIGVGNAISILSRNGVARVVSTAYNPVYSPGSGDPLAGTTPVRSERSFGPHLSYGFWCAENVGGTRSLPGGWNLSLDLYTGRFWNEFRSLNINAPLNGDPNGPRALGIPNLNNNQVNTSGQGRVNAQFFGLEQHQIKWLQMFFGAVHVDLIDDTNDDLTFTPQSSFSNAGEFARRAGQPLWNIFGNASVTLPEKIVVSGNLQSSGGDHYNLLTGFDNNGDGNFNDRPQIAAPGTPGATPTPYGLLVASGGQGVLGRDLGVMPWVVFLDTNVQRAFALTRNSKAEHQQTLTVNVRSANVLNHTNVTQVGGVLGSPLFGVPYQASTGRRVEAGLRYSF